MQEIYPEAPGFVRGSDTSKAAADTIQPDTARQKREILDFIGRFPTTGATCDEVEWGLGIRHQTASARISELKAAGRIIDSGARRPTASGRKAAVYVIAPATETEVVA
jgi:hypothetical protein